MRREGQGSQAPPYLMPIQGHDTPCPCAWLFRDSGQDRLLSIIHGGLIDRQQVMVMRFQHVAEVAYRAPTHERDRAFRDRGDHVVGVQQVRDGCQGLCQIGVSERMHVGGDAVGGGDPLIRVQIVLFGVSKFVFVGVDALPIQGFCLLYTSPSPRD